MDQFLQPLVIKKIFFFPLWDTNPNPSTLGPAISTTYVDIIQCDLG
jgi:hypothetical protein